MDKVVSDLEAVLAEAQAVTGADAVVAAVQGAIDAAKAFVAPAPSPAPAEDAEDAAVAADKDKLAADEAADQAADAAPDAVAEP